MKYDCLLVNGDSYSSPAEYLVWPDYLAENLKLHVINLAIEGSNNKRILRSTIEFLESDAMLGKNPLVVIGWSFLSRHEIWYYGKNEEIKNKAPDNEKRQEDSKLKFITLDWIMGTKDENDYYKSLVLNRLDHPHKTLTDFYIDIFLLTQYLKLKNLDYFFFSGANNEDSNPYWLRPATDLHICYKVLNDKKIKNLHDFSLSNWAKNNDSNCDSTYHLSPDGHQKFAVMLEREIYDIQSHT